MSKQYPAAIPTRRSRSAIPAVLAVLAAGIVVAAGARTAAAAELALPFAVPSIADAKPGRCTESLPPPVTSLKVTSRYDQSDKTKSTVDEEADQAYAAGMQPVRDFAEAVTADATAWFESGGRRTGKAACALDALAAWADADALSDLDTRQALLSSTRIVAGVALAYRVVKPSAAGTAEQRRRIDAWLGRLAARIRPGYSADGDRRLSDRQNHRYWAGFAMAALGVAAGDRAALQWGLDSYRIGACQVRDDGALPLELARGKRARDYHVHATAPLVMIAELAEANGLDAYDLCEGALHRLVAFDLAALADPSEIEAITGARQVELPSRDGMIRGDRIAWLAPYLTRFPQTPVGFAIPPRLTSSSLGGNLAAYYGFGPAAGE